MLFLFHLRMYAQFYATIILDIQPSGPINHSKIRTELKQIADYVQTQSQVVA